MRVLVYEQWRSGHYFNYLQHLLPRLSELADEVVVAMTAEALVAREFEDRLGACRRLRNLRFEGNVPYAHPALPLRERLSLLTNLRDAVRDAKPDYLLVPSADAQTLAMGALGHFGVRLLPAGLPSEATFHQGYGPAAANAKQFMKEAVYRAGFAGSGWTRLNFVNVLYYQYALRHCRWAERARLVPDPVPAAPRMDRREARRRLGMPEDGRYCGLLGVLDGRKAVPELLAAFRAARLRSEDRLLLAGNLDADFRALIARDYGDLVKSGRVVVLDRFLSDEEMAQGYAALDLACVTYRNFPGLASLMLRAVAAERPVIAHDFGWCGAMVRRFGFGALTDIEDRDRFARDLADALENSAGYTESEETRRLLAFHDPDNFAETMLDGVRERTGKPPRAPLRTWQWVTGVRDA